jgi:hypothetical protein
VTREQLLFGACVLIGSLYMLYRLGVWMERRHKERCYICAGEIDLKPRDWKRESHYWSSADNRWAHTGCKLEQVEALRKTGAL